MAFLPSVNLRRTFLIARRDYLGYVKTVGFWVSFLLPFLGAGIGFAVSQFDFEFSPPRYEAILDESGQHKEGILNLYEERQARLFQTVLEGAGPMMLSKEQVTEIENILKREGTAAAQARVNDLLPSSVSDQLKFTDPKMIFVEAPAKTVDATQAYLRGDAKIMHNGEAKSLSGLLHIRETDEGPIVAYWSKNINARGAKNLANDYFKRRAETAYLESAGLSREGLSEARRGGLEIDSFDPTKVSEGDVAEAVTKEDRAPYMVAAALAFFLWLTVFSGAYMLLTSMLEEKLNKLLEMMLASTRFAEIIFGKLLGVAALTLTAMAPYIILGFGGIAALFLLRDNAMAQAIIQSFTPQMVIFFFIFLVLGYIFYGACFIAMGALSQSMQDAQTITTPIVIILTLCVLVVPFGFENPDSPLLRFASFFPLSSPFAVIVRLPANPPLWEVVLSAVILAVFSLGVIWAAGRIFRYGVLSGSGVGAIKQWFQRVILRKKA